MKKPIPGSAEWMAYIRQMRKTKKAYKRIKPVLKRIKRYVEYNRKHPPSFMAISKTINVRHKPSERLNNFIWANKNFIKKRKENDWYNTGHKTNMITYEKDGMQGHKYIRQHNTKPDRGTIFINGNAVKIVFHKPVKYDKSTREFL